MKGCRPLCHDEKKRLNQVTKEPNRDNLLVSLGLATGFRISELLSLQIKDVMAPNGKIMSFISLQARNTKNRQGRSQILNHQVKGTLKEWCRALLKRGATLESFIFVGRESRRFSKPITRQRGWQIVKGLFAKAGIFGQTGCHTLRKTFAKKLKDSGLPLEEIKDALGHVSISSTISYLSFDRDNMHNMILNMELF